MYILHWMLGESIVSFVCTDSQDRCLAELLASLAAEDHDSILSTQSSSKPASSCSQGGEQEDEEALEMSQEVWQGDHKEDDTGARCGAWSQRFLHS